MRRAAAAARTLALTLGVSLVAAACASDGADEPGVAGPDEGPDAVGGEVLVLAAASLTDVMDDVVALAATEHPDLRVTVSTGGSSALAQQVLAGAPADLLVFASEESMGPVTDAGLAEDPVLLATNTLQVVVPADGTAVTGLADLADPSVVVALCAAEVPCGAAAERALAVAGVTASVDTYERDVRAALTKVRLGEVDASLVYRTDVRAAGDEVRGIDLPADVAEASTTAYPATVLLEAPNPAGARAVLELLLSEAGREILGDAGFVLP